MSFDEAFSGDAFAKYEHLWVSDDRVLQQDMLLAQPMTVRCWKCDITLHDGPAKEGIRLAKQHALDVHGVTYKKRKNRKGFEMSPMDHKESVARGISASQRSLKWTKGTLTDWLHSYRAEHGKNPTCKERGVPSHDSVTREFGSWKLFTALPFDDAPTVNHVSHRAA